MRAAATAETYLRANAKGEGAAGVPPTVPHPPPVRRDVALPGARFGPDGFGGAVAVSGGRCFALRGLLSPRECNAVLFAAGAHEACRPMFTQFLQNGKNQLPPDCPARSRGIGLLPVDWEYARHDSAEDFCRLKALHCTAMDWIFIPAYRFAIP